MHLKLIFKNERKLGEYFGNSRISHKYTHLGMIITHL
jgi:hypothetical protein